MVGRARKEVPVVSALHWRHQGPHLPVDILNEAGHIFCRFLSSARSQPCAQVLRNLFATTKTEFVGEFRRRDDAAFWERRCLETVTSS